MGFRFWRRKKIAPGVTLNLSKSGGSLSFGTRGAHYTAGPRGQRATAGIPGTGLFYTTTLKGGGGKGRAAPPPGPADADRLSMGFFKRLVTPRDHEDLVDGCRELAGGNEAAALGHLEQALHLADAAYLAGFIALNRGHAEKAGAYLAIAADRSDRLGSVFGQYGISPTLLLPITDEVTALVGPDQRGVLLGLVELHQMEERPREALESLRRLQELDPRDVVVRLSAAELLLDLAPGDRETCREVVERTGEVTNESHIHAALMLYKARALRCLGLSVAARDTLTAALRRRKDRPPELLRTLRYERAQVYGELGRRSRARSEYERIYAEDPDFEDVADRLGL